MRHGIIPYLLIASLLAGATQVAAQGTSGDDGVDHDAAKPSSEAAELPQSVEDILTRDPGAEDYGEEVRCVSTRRIRGTEVIDDRHVAFQIDRGQYLLVQLAYPCPMLRRGQPIMYEPTGNRLCQNDTLRAVSDFGGMRPGPICPIPGFQTVSKEQLHMIKDALKAERRRQREG